LNIEGSDGFFDPFPASAVLNGIGKDHPGASPGVPDGQPVIIPEKPIYKVITDPINRFIPGVFQRLGPVHNKVHRHGGIPAVQSPRPYRQEKGQKKQT
jgi:hypothetical protein